MTIKDELVALSKKQPKLTTGYVVDWAAKNKTSALHSALEWDDAIAGRKYREWQVRQLIGMYVFDDQGDRALISLSVDRAVGGYRALEEIAKAPDLMAVMRTDAEEELIRTRNKYRRVKELIDVWTAIDRVETKRVKGKAA